MIGNLIFKEERGEHETGRNKVTHARDKASCGPVHACTNTYDNTALLIYSEVQTNMEGESTSMRRQEG